jgi:alpha-methylacyl-CoA racemase
VSIGSIEPQFYALLLDLTGLAGDPAFRAQMDRSQWPALSEKLAAVIRTKTRDEWCAIMEGTDVCFAPVLNWAEAPSHPHNAARETFTTIAGVVQPNVAPRFSGTPSAIQGPPPKAGGDNEAVFADWGIKR